MKLEEDGESIKNDWLNQFDSKIFIKISYKYRINFHSFRIHVLFNSVEMM